MEGTSKEGPHDVSMEGKGGVSSLHRHDTTSVTASSPCHCPLTTVTSITIVTSIALSAMISSHQHHQNPPSQAPPSLVHSLTHSVGNGPGTELHWALVMAMSNTGDVSSLGELTA